MTTFERHCCNADMPVAVGLIYTKQTTEIFPFKDSRDVVLLSESECRNCGAIWRISRSYSQKVTKWDESEDDE